MSSRKRYEDLTLADDFIFWKVMSRQHIAKEFLEALLGREIKNITYTGGQITHQEYYDVHGVRFDVEFHGDNKLYDIEMQQCGGSSEEDVLELTNRARYYHANLLHSRFKPSDKYKNLPETYVVFICRFDPFGMNQLFYAQRHGIVPKTPLFQPHEFTLYLNSKADRNTKANVSKVIKSFLRYLEGLPYESNSLMQSIDRAVGEVKSSYEDRRMYMSFQEKLDREREAGREEERESIIARLVALGMSEEQLRKVISSPPSGEESADLSNLQLQ